jgi:hypothetical protein
VGRAALVLLLVAGCGERVEYHRVEFPGFSFEVPTAVTYGEDRTTEYRAGDVEARGSSWLVKLEWHPGAITSVEEMPQLARAFRVGIPESVESEVGPARAIRVGGQDATQVDILIATSPTSIIEIACGRRTVMVSITTRGAIQAMRDRILGSFDCQPIAELESKLGAGASPFGIDDPALLASWYRVDDEDEFMISNGELMVHASQRPGIMERFGDYLPAIFSATGGSWTSGRSETRPNPAGERTFYHGRMVMEGDAKDAMNAVATAWRCSGRSDAVLVFAFSPSGSDLAPAIDLIAKLRCAKIDDPPLLLAPAPPETSL